MRLTCINALIQYAAHDEKKKVSPFLRKKSPKRNALQCYSIENSFSPLLQTAFSNAGNSRCFHVCVCLRLILTMEKRWHTPNVADKKPLTVKNRRKKALKYCVNFSSLNKIYCIPIRLIGVFRLPNEIYSKQQWFSWSDCMK